MRRIIALLALAVVGALALHLPLSSGATFSSRTQSTGTVSAANDWTPPTVSLRDPGSTVTGTVTLTADASDARSAVASVTIQYLPQGGSWTTVCTATTAPYSCSWNTTGLADGSYALRATASDTAGYSTTSTSVSTTVANRLLLVLGDPGDVVRGSLPLTATLYNAGLVGYQITIQYSDASSTTPSWKTLCGPSATTTSSYTCTWNTAGTGFTQGGSYDLRAVATTAANLLPVATSATVPDVLIDNVAPAVTLADPGSPLRGTVTLSATATDADSGVGQVQLQLQRSGSTAWTTACTLTLDPYSCRYDTTQLADGTYSFRAVATDQAGNVTTSSTVANRVVDNTVSSVSLEDPGAYLTGTLSLVATASSTAGVTSVRIDRAPAGTTTWTPVCTDTAAPYSCLWDTTTVPDGSYDLRAVLTDGKGGVTTSSTVAARRVDNSPLRGYDVQGTSGGAIVGRVDAGDSLRLTYTSTVSPASILTGWTGSATPVTVRLRDGNLLGAGSAGDTVDVLSGSSAVNLGTVNLRGDYIKSNRTASFNATMTASTTTVNGATATVVTLTLGSQAGGSGLRTVSTSPTMIWTPSAAAKDAGGKAVSTTPATERGLTDRDF